MLDWKKYGNTSYEDMTWENCDLREWLNGSFLYDAFTEEEQGRILTKDVVADNNTSYDTFAGNDTKDKVYLLSTREVNNYFHSEEERQCTPTEYAFVQCDGTFYSRIATKESNCYWWLRTPGRSEKRVSYVNQSGEIDQSGRAVDDEGAFVRPVLWISFEP